MYLKNISIKNFKGIQEMKLEFQSGVNLLIGDNGAGKSSVLGAVIVAIGGYFQGVNGVNAKGIQIDDIRIKTYPLAGASNAIEYQLPVEIEANFDISGENMKFFRKKVTSGSKGTQLLNCKKLADYASELTNQPDSFLPIFSYQGIHREKSEAKTGKIPTDRRAGYFRCMENVSNVKEITAWCLQMELEAFKKNIRIPEYETFKRIVAVFMQHMNELETLPEISYERQLDEICYTENQNTLPISKLSAGYQSILFMMLDIAYRLAVLNPAFENSKDAEGIILIDEIDLHLHPKWQWNVLNALEKTLPNVQFIIATHSPIVISSCKNENLIMLDENQNVRYLENAYAYSIKDILELRQESYSIPKKLQQLSSLFENYLNDENYAKAKEILEEMTAQFGENNSEVIRAKWLLNLEE